MNLVSWRVLVCADVLKKASVRKSLRVVEVDDGQVSQGCGGVLACFHWRWVAFRVGAGCHEWDRLIRQAARQLIQTGVGTASEAVEAGVNFSANKFDVAKEGQ